MKFLAGESQHTPIIEPFSPAAGPDVLASPPGVPTGSNERKNSHADLDDEDDREYGPLLPRGEAEAELLVDFNLFQKALPVCAVRVLAVNSVGERCLLVLVTGCWCT